MIGSDIVEPAPDERELVELDADDCAALLALESVGRVAVAAGSDEGPDVVPVNFILRDGAPVFRCHDGVVLDRLLTSPVSLQVDRFDWFHRTGWSVVVRGTAALIDSAEVAELDGDEPDTWIPTDDTLWVRITPARVSGRRIVLHQVPLDHRGYL